MSVAAGGHEELDSWLDRHGLAATRAWSARVYVAEDTQETLMGYFALAAGSVEYEGPDERSRKGMARHPIPVALLARLAVAKAAQGRGIGRELVWHAAGLTLKATRLIAVRALIVDALDRAGRPAQSAARASSAHNLNRILPGRSPSAAR